jgi:hypothetical protein
LKFMKTNLDLNKLIAWLKIVNSYLLQK